MASFLNHHFGIPGPKYRYSLRFFQPINLQTNGTHPNGYTLEDEGLAGTYSHHPWKERNMLNMIWTKPPWGHVPAVNLQGCKIIQQKLARPSFNVFTMNSPQVITHLSMLEFFLPYFLFQHFSRLPLALNTRLAAGEGKGFWSAVMEW